MSELYVNLSFRYQNKSFWIDDNGLKGVILHNESLQKVKTMLVRFKYSKYCLDKETGEYKFDLIEFVKLALTKGYDWRLFGKPEWEALKPKSKPKFIKPKKVRRIK